jgi:elongation factor Ts
MAEITAALVKELREKTGAGMMDCKKALSETGGDLEAAIDWLRKKGLAAAAKKAGRVAAEGVVAVAVKGTVGAVIELNSETDFVARNDAFQALAKNAADIALGKGGDVAAIGNAALGSGQTVQAALTDLIAKIGENMNLRRAAAVSVANGVVTSYVHNAYAPGLGKIGVLVGLESTGDAGKLEAVAKQLAMHIAAAAPQALSIEAIDPALVARERDVLAEKARASGKPANIIEKMVEGGLRKFYQEAVLLEQTSVMDGETKIADVVAKAAKDVGAPVTLKGFVRMALGEGVEKKEDDFAAEVAKLAG